MGSNDFPLRETTSDTPRIECKFCGRSESVKKDKRTKHPHVITTEKLRKKCEQDGCSCSPHYIKGLIV